MLFVGATTDNDEIWIPWEIICMVLCMFSCIFKCIHVY